MNKKNLYLAGTTLGAVALATAFFAGRALAGGIPATGALTYSGLLQDASGAALTGSHAIQVNFWNAATGGTTPACQTASTPITLDAGRFSVALPDTCTDIVKTNKDTWADVLVDGISLGRTKLGAVPYAVEAGHSTAADTATNATTAATANAAGGGLDTRLKALEAPRSLACQRRFGSKVLSINGVGSYLNNTSVANCVAGETMTGCGCRADNGSGALAPNLQASAGCTCTITSDLGNTSTALTAEAVCCKIQ